MGFDEKLFKFIEVKIPGGFDALSFFNATSRCNKLKELGEEEENNNEENDNETLSDEPFRPANYYISRYQVWQNSKIDECQGQL
jgi:hypothetical protein